MTLYELKNSIFANLRLLVIFVVVAVLLCNIGLSFIQSYTSEVVIKYSDINAISGTGDDGSSIDQAKIGDPSVVKQALLTIGEDIDDVNTISKKIKVTPIIAVAEEEKYASWLENFSSYSETEEERSNPVYYSVKFESDKGPVYTEKVLNAVIRSYAKYYQKEHGNISDKKLLPSNLVTQYDYFEASEILGKAINYAIDYIGNIRNSDVDYRSTTTGYSMSDLLTVFEDIKQIDYAAIEQKILEGGYSRDGKILVHALEQRAIKNEMDATANKNKAAAQKEMMDLFSKKNKEYLWDATVYDDESEQVREDTERDRRYVTTKTTYDTMILDYVGYLNQESNLLIDRDYNKKYASYFANYVDSAEIEAELTAVVEKYNAIFKIAEETLNEYNEYKQARSVGKVSGIATTKTVSELIYYAMAFVVALGLGIVYIIVKDLLKSREI